jgi:hypothetical protein
MKSIFGTGRGPFTRTLYDPSWLSSIQIEAFNWVRSGTCKHHFDPTFSVLKSSYLCSENPRTNFGAGWTALCLCGLWLALHVIVQCYFKWVTDGDVSVSTEVRNHVQETS